MTGRRHESETIDADEGNADEAAGAGAAAATAAAAGSDAADTGSAAATATGSAAAAGRRLRGFGLHLIFYVAAMIVLVPVNFLTTPDHPWIVLPMVGWGSALALHAAHAMGLFQAFGRKKR